MDSRDVRASKRGRQCEGTVTGQHERLEESVDIKWVSAG